VNDSRIIPVFIFSLPRTGSTLLQRLLAAHPDVSTTAEPWILLPILYGRRERGVVAEYGHRSQVRALEDFREHLPRGEADIDDAVRAYALGLYQKASSLGSRYFVDKTPRYHVIAEEIMRVFGNSARYVFLWRNPLAVVASIVTTWGGGRWKFNAYYIDLFEGLAALTDAYRRWAPSAHALRYEDLVADPSRELAACLGYIGLDRNDDLADRLSTIRLQGRMGDPTGVDRFGAVSKQSLESWKTVLVGPYRRAWSRHYLAWIGPERLNVMGYDSAKLLKELASTRHLSIGQVSDVWYHAIGLAKQCVRTRFVSRLD
jgi:Sulfotransferase family